LAGQSAGIVPSASDTKAQEKQPIHHFRDSRSALEAVEKYQALEGGQQTLGKLAAYVTEIVRKEVED
jgi:hypothetical protein